MDKRVGIVGLGRMGRALAVRFKAQGWTIAGWTRSGADAELGISACAGLDQLAARSDVILLSLFDDAAVNTVLDDLLKHDLKGKILVDTSTVSPTLLSNRMDEIAKSGATALDAPISGGPEMVLDGVAGVFAGGSSDDFKDVKPVLEQFSNQIHHIGALGSGLAMKAVNNGLLQGYLAALFDVVKIAKRSGLPLEQTLNLIAGGPAACQMIVSRVPKMLGEDKTVGFNIYGAAKDAGVFEKAANDLGLDVPALSLAKLRFHNCIDAGLGERDIAALISAAFDEA